MSSDITQQSLGSNPHPSSSGGPSVATKTSPSVAAQSNVHYQYYPSYGYSHGPQAMAHPAYSQYSAYYGSTVAGYHYPPQQHPSCAQTSSQPPVASTQPLSDAPSTVLNAENAAKVTQRRARATASAQAKNSSKKSRRVATAFEDTENTTPSTPEACGVGPISESMDTEGADPPPSTGQLDKAALAERISQMHADLVQSHTDSGRSGHQGTSPSSATDVWAFMVPVSSKEKPFGWDPETTYNAPLITQRPKTPAVACRACAHHKVWRPYVLTQGSGITTSLRNHLRNHHHDAYAQTVEAFGLKHAGEIPSDGGDEPGAHREPFSVDTANRLLAKWLAADDQSTNLLECPEFREYVLYVGQGNITNSDLPKRTAMSELITKLYLEEMARVMVDLSSSLGRISFSMDLWSDTNLRSFMAVTAHYIVRDKDDGNRLKYRSGLIAFRYVPGDHSGVNLAEHFLEILKKLKITNRIGVITMDNASNNDTLMRSMQTRLEALGVHDFHADGNRVRCFPHVVNLACQAIIDELQKKNLDEDDYNAPDHIKNHSAWPKFVQMLQSGLISRVREIIASCRKSGRRRLALQRIIAEGNTNGWWDDGIKLPLLQLLRDCETRWSSTYLLLDRFLKLYPAVMRLCQDYELDGLTLTVEERNVLFQLHSILGHAHRTQELLCSERTPTLSMAIPTYELLIQLWKEQKEALPEMSHFIDLGITKLESYLKRTLDSRIYSIAMVINPAMKMAWTGSGWAEAALQSQESVAPQGVDYLSTAPDMQAFGDQASDEFKKAKEWIVESMLKFQTARRQAQSADAAPTNRGGPALAPVQRSSSDTAAAALSSGFQFAKRGPPLSRATSMFNMDPSPSPTAQASSTGSTPSTSGPDTLRSAATRVPTESELLAQDKLIVEREFTRYLEAGLVPSGLRGLNQLIFWEQHEHTFPNLFRIAMDVLPCQASAVACERVFSSSKETCTLKRSRLGEETIEALQVLKYSTKQQRISFMDHEIAREEDYTLEGPLTEYAIQELIASNSTEVLEDLLSNSEEPLSFWSSH